MRVPPLAPDEGRDAYAVERAAARRACQRNVGRGQGSARPGGVSALALLHGHRRPCARARTARARARCSQSTRRRDSARRVPLGCPARVTHAVHGRVRLVADATILNDDILGGALTRRRRRRGRRWRRGWRWRRRRRGRRRDCARSVGGERRGRVRARRGASAARGWAPIATSPPSDAGAVRRGAGGGAAAQHRHSARTEALAKVHVVDRNVSGEARAHLALNPDHGGAIDASLGQAY